MKQLSIKEAFGGEVNFTNHISQNKDVSQRLLNCIDMVTGSDYTVKSEHQTVDNKRVDLTIQNEEGEIITVIESQDATGWLDSVHSSKVFYYMHEKKCMDGVLLTEDATEHVKSYLRFMNENTPFNVWLLAVRIYKTDDKSKPYIDFVPVMRPTSLNEKRITRKSKKTSSGQNEYKWADFLAEKYEQHQDIFTNVSSYYIDVKNVSGSKINVGIEPRTDFFNVTMHHGGRYDTEEFRSNVKRFHQERKLDASEPFYNSFSARFRASNWEDALNTAKILISSITDRSLVYGKSIK